MSNLPDELLDDFVKHSQNHALLTARLDEHINYSNCQNCKNKESCGRRIDLEKEQLENGRSGAEIMNKCMAIWLTEKPLPGMTQ
jgi:hypothetical protein